ncbi:MAG: hypothetical protein GX980_10100 [Firmicutes bacterium]|nr:hypothetical protein [Bacillota bacterium]
MNWWSTQAMPGMAGGAAPALLPAWRKASSYPGGKCQLIPIGLGHSAGLILKS